jgi:MFS family permease
VTLRERGKYQGILGSCVGLGNTLGPFLAAVFVEKASWRALFWFISPLVLLSGAITLVVVPSKRPTDSIMSKVRKVDYLGSLFSTAGIILLLIPISGGGTYFAWKSPMVIVMLNLGGICMVLFLVTEWKVARLPIMPRKCSDSPFSLPLSNFSSCSQHAQRRPPSFTVRLFRSPAVSAILAQNFLYGIVYYSILYYLPIYFQAVRRFTPLASAALQITVVIGQSLASIASGQYISRCGRYGELLWLGYGLWTLGAALTCLFSRTIPVPAIAAILFIEGIGVGNCFQPTLIASQAHCLKADRAVIISTRNFCRTLGGATGLAVSASLFSNVLQSHLSHSHHSLPRSYLKTITSSIFTVPDLQHLSNAQRNDVLDAYMAASRALFIMWVPIMAVCWASCVFVKDRGLTRPDEMEETALVVADVEGGKSSAQEQHGLDDATPAYEMEEGGGKSGNENSNETGNKKAPVADSKRIEKNTGSCG